MGVYLDNAATAEYRTIDDIVVDTIVTAMRDSWMNPSSIYSSNIKDKISKCRKNIAEFIEAKPEEIYFTSGASESNNWAIAGWDKSIKNCTNSIIISTTIEHKSILRLLESGCLNSNVHYCGVNELGNIDCETLECLLMNRKDNPVLVSVCMANNEIGTIQDIRKIADLVHKYNGILHVDATQSFGHIHIDVNELGIDMLSASGHKISPVLKGIGFLYKRKGVMIEPLVYGMQENGLRGGTENTFGIIGLNKALEYCNVSVEKVNKLQEKRDYFIERLETRFGCKLNGSKDNRLPNNINVTFPQDISAESLLYMLETDGIRISSGSACNSNGIETSHILDAIGLNKEDAMKTIRITISDHITYGQINYVIDEIEKTISIIKH